MGQEAVRHEGFQITHNFVGNLHKLPRGQETQMAPLGGVFSGWGQSQGYAVVFRLQTSQVVGKKGLQGQSPCASTPGLRLHPPC